MAGLYAAAPSKPNILFTAARAETTVEAWLGGNKPKPMPVRTLATLSGFKTAAAPRLDEFGGWVDGPKCSAGTGFFRAEKVGDRWWLVTPKGHVFIHVGVAAVSPGAGPTLKESFKTRFHDDADWASQTAGFLRTNGFNGTGYWSADAELAAAPQRLAYTPGINFMAEFGKTTGLMHVEGRHKKYEDGLIPVFNPEFPAFCEKLAKQFAATKNDPWLIGIFSDNELPLLKTSLDRYLELPEDDPGHKEVRAWLATRKAGARKITNAEREAWTAHVMDRYYTIVGAAIHAADPNHLYLGTRLHGSEEGDNEALWKVAGKHLPVIAFNVYGRWHPLEQMRKWERWAGRPVIVSEWYAKAHDVGLANKIGAGWNVKTQNDRALFYQQFTLSLLESRACVGWHWFKYADVDRENADTGRSERGVNTGIVNGSYQPYVELLESMKELNTQVYPLTTHFDAKRPK